jgi:hypothetical protein
MRGSGKLIAVVCLAALAGTGQAETPDREKVTSLFKMFLRDSAELPMDVAVTTVVTNARGRQTRRSETTVHLLFKGYSQQAERFTWTSHGGFLHLRQLHDSLAGDFNIFKAFAMVVPDKNGETKWNLAEAGAGLLVRLVQTDCKGFEMNGELYPKVGCSSVEFHLGRNAAGDLKVERFTLDSQNLPAAGRLRYLGDVQVRRYHAEGDVQDGYLPNDPRPFLVPRRVVTTIETDKGTIVVTDEHSMAAPETKRK